MRRETHRFLQAIDRFDRSTLLMQREAEHAVRVRAVRLKQFGLEGLVVEDVPEPIPGPGELLLRVRAVSFRDVEASAPDALLVIEVADTSLAYDREVKGRLYARAGALV